MKDNRLRKRVPFETEVILTIGKVKRKFTKTRDISMNGLSVETEEIIQIGTEGNMELILSSGLQKIIIKSKFRVARVFAVEKDKKRKSLSSGFGIELFGFEEDSSEQLYNIIKYNQGEK